MCYNTPGIYRTDSNCLLKNDFFTSYNNLTEELDIYPFFLFTSSDE